MVIVMDMKMPKTCEDCDFEYDGRCLAPSRRMTDIPFGIDRPEWCPLLDVKAADFQRLLYKEK